MDIKRSKKEKRIQRLGGLIGICVAVVSLFYFFHAEKAEAEKRMVEIVNYVKVQCYVDAVAAHEESIVQYMKDDDASFRILEEPLMITGIGVAFAKDDDRGICEQMGQTLEEMRQDGSSLKIIEKYLDDPDKYLEVDDLGY